GGGRHARPGARPFARRSRAGSSVARRPRRARGRCLDFPHDRAGATHPALLRAVLVIGARAGAVALLAIALGSRPASAASVTGRFVGGSPPAPLEAVEVVLPRAADPTLVAPPPTAAHRPLRLHSRRFDGSLPPPALP